MRSPKSVLKIAGQTGPEHHFDDAFVRAISRALIATPSCARSAKQ
jgi:hypothetical protein